jgi:hypothetical protein
LARSSSSWVFNASGHIKFIHEEHDVHEEIRRGS